MAGNCYPKLPAMLVAIGLANACASPIDENATRVIAFDAEEFTDAHVDVSPDGRTIVFDVLGDLYTVPVTGGDAIPLTAGSAWDIRPRFSPDGKRIAFISDRGGGEATLWTINARGGNATEYTVARPGWMSGLVPAWGPDGALLDLVPSEPAPSMALHRLVKPQQSVPFSDVDLDLAIHRSTFSADGRFAYHGGARLQQVDLRSGESVDLGVDPELGSIESPRISRSGDQVAYVARRNVADTGDACALRVRELRTGNDEALADIPGCIVSDYDFLPDGTAIIANFAGRLTRIDVASGERRIIPVRVHVERQVNPPLRQVGWKIADGGEVRAKVIRWPTLAPNGSELVFDAFAKIYAMHLLDGNARRVTAGEELEYAPAPSPDGRWVAYTTWSDTELGHVMIAPLHGGKPRQLTTVPGRYVNPVWSPDGTRIAFIADETEARFGLSPKFAGPMTGKWALALKWISVADGGDAHRVLTTSPIKVEPNRFHPVPAFSAGGDRIFIARYMLSDEYGQPGPVLVSVGLDGRDVVPHLRLPEADEVVVSPDGRRVAIVWQGRLYVAFIPYSTGTDVPEVDLGAIRPITTDMPVHVYWQDGDTLVWTTANSVHRYRLGAGAPEWLADIDVRRTRPMPEGCFALVDARLITMKGNEVIEPGTVVVCGNRIAAAGRADAVSTPEGAQRVDASGTTIIPGLVDAHAHFHHPPSEVWLQQNIGYIGSLAHGVTTLYDPSAPTLEVFGQAEMVEAGEIAGPRIYSSGAPILDERQGRNSSNGRVIRSLDDARTVVSSYARYGAGPLKEYFNTHRDRRQWLAQAAREAGISLTSHFDGYPAVLTRIVDGYTAIEHDLGTNRVGGGPFGDDVLEFVAASGVNYTRDSLGGLFDEEVDVEDPKLRRFNPEERLLKEASSSHSPRVRGWLLTERTQSARTLKRLTDLGGLVSIGAHGNGVPGLALHWELWALVLYGGMDPYDALRAATLNGARKLSLDADLGSIEAGKVADLVVLNSNPLENIRNSTDIRYVIKGGFVYDGDSMTQIWPTRKELGPWPWQSEADRKRFAAPDPDPFPSARQ